MDRKNAEFECLFDINKVSFDNANSDFERKFRDHYNRSLAQMTDSRDRLTNAGGASSLGVLEAMARRMDMYDKNSDFDKSYSELQKELEPFTET